MRHSLIFLRGVEKMNEVTAVYQHIESVIQELNEKSWKALELDDDGEEFIRIKKEISLWEYLKFCLLNRGGVENE